MDIKFIIIGTLAVILIIMLLIWAYYDEKNNRIRLQRLIDKYGAEIGTNIFKGVVFVGYTKEQLIEAWGKPKDIKETVSSSIVKTRCYYGRYYTSQGNAKYSQYVDLKDDVVIGWGDIK